MPDKTDERLQLAGSLVISGAAAYGAWRLAVSLGRFVINKMTTATVNILLRDSYTENMWELVHSAARMTPELVVETALRAEHHGDILARPLGSRLHYNHFDKLLFDYAQLARVPRPVQLPVQTDVVIGPQAGRPLHLQIPIMISGMAYGLALSGPAKLALAKGAAMVGTNAHSGEGVLAPGELKAAGTYIYQISRSNWNRVPKDLARIDAIEIQLGQGASGGTGWKAKVCELPVASRRQFHTAGRKSIQTYVAHPEMQEPGDLGKMVQWLRSLTDVPIGVKIGAGKYLEEDLDIIIAAGIDYVWVDGSEAGSHAAAPTLEDDHGLPTFFALCRADHYFRTHKLKGKVSLIVSGGLYTPGDYIKCLALGADAVGVGTAALFAISHRQVGKYLPFEPPTELTFATGKYWRKFNVEQGAQSLAYYLQSCANEMALSARAVGKAGVSQVNRDDLTSVSPFVAQIAQVNLASTPPPAGSGKAAQSAGLRKEHWQAHKQAMHAERILPIWERI